MNDQRPLIIRLNAQDNVAVALQGLATGAVISKEGVVCREEIPAGHKVALSEIMVKESVRKYGQIIGFATKSIRPGEWVHNHNMTMGDFARDYAIGEDARPTRMVSEEDRRL